MKKTQRAQSFIREEFLCVLARLALALGEVSQGGSQGGKSRQRRKTKRKIFFDGFAIVGPQFTAGVMRRFSAETADVVNVLFF